MVGPVFQRIWAWRGLLLLVGALLGPTGCTYVSTEAPRYPASVDRDRADYNLKVYDRVVQLVSKHYFDATFGGLDWPGFVARYRNEAVLAESDVELYKTINVLLQELKASHLMALSPAQAVEEHTRRRARVGLMWHRYGKEWVVEDVVAGGPAEEAGIERGWVVEKVDDVPAELGIRRRLAIGESVTLTFRDKQEAIRKVTLSARMLTMETPLREWILDGGYVYLRFDEFERRTRRWLSDALKRHSDAPGIIIDLRYNHGGQLFSLDLVVGEFFPKSVPIGRMIRRSGGAFQQDSRQWASARFDRPVVLLTDDSSYSAAEILSHVLQYYQRATIVGRKTGGAVVAARSYGLPGGGEVQVPILDYVGLRGLRLEGNGVEPDVMVERSLKALREGRDVDIEAALRVLRAKTGS